MIIQRILTGRIRPQFFFAPPDDDGGGEGDGDNNEQTRVGGKEPIHISKGAREFGKRFQPPTGIPPAKDESLVNETPEQKAEREKKESDTTQRTQDDPRNRRPGQNVPKIIEDKRKAESELGEARTKLENYEKKQIPELNQKISDLQSKIDSGDFSPAKEREFQAKIEALEKTKSEEAETLKKELATTRQRLSAYDLTEDPAYKEKYLRPLGESIEQIKGIVGTNVVLNGVVNRAMMAQRSALSASTQEDRYAAEQERDRILEGILDGMTSVQQRRFNSAFDRFMETSESQAVAMAQHEKTSLEIRKESEVKFKEATQQTLNEWTSAFDAQAGAYDPDLATEKEVEDKIKELGIEVNLEVENKFARRAIEGGLSKAEVVDIVHRGRVYKKNRAVISAQAAIIKELRETVDKLKGAAPGGGSSDRSAPSVKSSEQKKAESRHEFNQRFRPPVTA